MVLLWRFSQRSCFDILHFSIDSGSVAYGLDKRRLFGGIIPLLPQGSLKQQYSAMAVGIDRGRNHRGVGAVLGFVPQMLLLFAFLAFGILRLHGARRIHFGSDIPSLRALRQIVHSDAHRIGLWGAGYHGLQNH
jgi:hypothetical protein